MDLMNTHAYAAFTSSANAPDVRRDGNYAPTTR
jgi:hypothetical protein